MKISILEKPNFDKIAKNLRFGIATGLTNTAKAGQTEVLREIKSGFITRGNWMNPANKFGVRITAATKTNLESAVRTDASWLQKHETGGTIRPRGRAFAVPTENVRRNKRQIIPKAQRPRGLKNVFVLQTQRGPVLFQRLFANKAGKYSARRFKTNRGSQIVALYGLERTVKIKQKSVFFAPLRTLTRRRTDEFVAAGIKRALATAR